jgi:hypothetical protein
MYSSCIEKLPISLPQKHQKINECEKKYNNFGLITNGRM